MMYPTKNPLIDFCEITNPIYPINLSNLCVISLFTNQDWKSTWRDYYAVTKGFPLVSAPVAESEFDDFKGANAFAPMYQDEFKWPIYHTDKPFTWKKEQEMVTWRKRCRINEQWNKCVYKRRLR